MDLAETILQIKFNFYTLSFKPYKRLEGNHNSKSILMECITYLSNQLLEGNGHLIDRFENRKSYNTREIFMSRVVIIPAERKIRCSLAMIRSGHKPKLKPKDKFALLPIKDIGKIAEETNFIIDFSRSPAIICVEYNFHGPRMSDLEYYLRNVSNEKLKISKHTEVRIIINNSLTETLQKLKNVLRFEIKLQPRNIDQIEKAIANRYLYGLKSFGKMLKPQVFKIDSSFYSPGNIVRSSELNKDANGMVNDFLNLFKKKPENIDCFEGFYIEYEDMDGNDSKFNLLSGKMEIIKEWESQSPPNLKESYNLIKQDLDLYIGSLT